MSQGERTSAAGEHGTDDVMELLAEHVPLALLVDLVTPEGPASEEILRAEGIPQDAWWEAGDGPQPGPAGDGESGPAGGPARDGAAAEG